MYNAARKNKAFLNGEGVPAAHLTLFNREGEELTLTFLKDMLMVGASLTASCPVVWATNFSHTTKIKKIHSDTFTFY